MPIRTDIFIPANKVIGVLQSRNLGSGGTGGGSLFLADNQTFKSLGSASSSSSVTASVVAQDTLAHFDPVTITGRKADSANNAYFGKVIGLANTAIAIGFSGDVLVEGLMTNGAWSWTAGATIFLNGTTLSQTAPSSGFVQAIGIAKNTTVIYVDLSVPILL